MTRFIALEGPDRVGKKTQTTLLKMVLSAKDKKTLLAEIPYDDGVTYRIIYWMLENGYASKYPTFFQVVHNTNKFLYQLINRKRFTEHDYVIFDRWRLSSFVYGFVTRANLRIVNRMFDRLICPDITIVLVGNRLTDKTEDEYEKNDKLQAEVRMWYKQATSLEKNVFVIEIDHKTREEVHKEVMNALVNRGILSPDVIIDVGDWEKNDE